MPLISPLMPVPQLSMKNLNSEKGSESKSKDNIRNLTEYAFEIYRSLQKRFRFTKALSLSFESCRLSVGELSLQRGFTTKTRKGPGRVICLRCSR